MTWPKSGLRDLCTQSKGERDEEATTHQRGDADGRAGCTIARADGTGAVWDKRRRGTDSEGVHDGDNRR